MRLRWCLPSVARTGIGIRLAPWRRARDCRALRDRRRQWCGPGAARARTGQAAGRSTRWSPWSGPAVTSGSACSPCRGRYRLERRLRLRDARGRCVGAPGRNTCRTPDVTIFSLSRRVCSTEPKKNARLRTTAPPKNPPRICCSSLLFFGRWIGQARCRARGIPRIVAVVIEHAAGWLVDAGSGQHADNGAGGMTAFALKLFDNTMNSFTLSSDTPLRAFDVRWSSRLKPSTSTALLRPIIPDATTVVLLGFRIPGQERGRRSRAQRPAVRRSPS